MERRDSAVGKCVKLLNSSIDLNAAYEVVSCKSADIYIILLRGQSRQKQLDHFVL